MIVKISRGARLGGLMRYLVGEGRRNEHTNPHLVAGSPEVMSWYSHRELSQGDARAIARVVDQPRIAHGTSVTVKAKARDQRQSGQGTTGAGGVLVDEGPSGPSDLRKQAHVWHCSLSLPPNAATLEDREGEGAGRQVLDDQTWEQLASDFVDEMGFTAASGKSPCRWVAVHHGVTAQGGDHVHLAVVLVREDGTRASTHNDYRTASAAAAKLEAKYGLEVVAGRHVGRSAAGLSAGEDALARQEPARQEPGGPVGQSYADRLTGKLRAAAAVAGSEAEFVERCQDAGLLLRPRFAAGSTSEVTGFAVAERGAPGEGEERRWRAAGKLSRDLTLPRLRDGFTETPRSREEAGARWRAARGLSETVAGDGLGSQALGARAGREAAPAAVSGDAEAEARRWRDAAVQVSGLREQLRGIPVDDHAAWASVSHEVAGVLAAWSAATEQRPGHLAAAADVMGRGAALHRRAVGPRPSRPLSLRGPALLVASLAAGPGSRTGQALLLRELLNLMRAVNLSLAASRQAREATRIEEAVRGRLRHLQATLPPPPKLSADLDPVQLVHRDLRHQVLSPKGPARARSSQGSVPPAAQPAREVGRGQDRDLEL